MKNTAQHPDQADIPFSNQETLVERMIGKEVELYINNPYEIVDKDDFETSFSSAHFYNCGSEE